MHPLLVEFKNGSQDCMRGGNPLWEIFLAEYRLTRKPNIIGGCLILIGYVSAFVTRAEKGYPEDVIRFRRMEQVSRLRALFSLRKWGGRWREQH